MNTKRVPKVEAGYVYVIEDESERVKLGKSKEADLRLKELQTGNAERLTVKYRIRVSDMHKAETSLHNLFAAYRLRADGEWFKITDIRGKILLMKIFDSQMTVTDREITQLKGLGLR